MSGSPIKEGLPVTRLLMVLSGMAPMFLIWAVRGSPSVKDRYFVSACLALAILPTLVLCIRIRVAKKTNDCQTKVIGKAEDHRDHILVYLFAMLLPFIILPAGMGFAVPAMTAAVLSSVDRRRSGTASAVLNAARQTGGAIGVAIFGALVGSTPNQIVQGLKLASLISVGLLLIATLVAWKGIRRTQETSEIDHSIGFQIE